VVVPVGQICPGSPCCCTDRMLTAPPPSAMSAVTTPTHRSQMGMGARCATHHGRARSGRGRRKLRPGATRVITDTPGRSYGVAAGAAIGAGRDAGTTLRIRSASRIPADRQQPASRVPGARDRGADRGVGARRRARRPVVVRVVVGLGHRGAVTRGSAEQENIPNRYVWTANSGGRLADRRCCAGTGARRNGCSAARRSAWLERPEHRVCCGW
jgi:hypothetical protein